MTFFFLVVGLEARREFDLGELRDRRRLILPAAAGLGIAAGVTLLLAGYPLWVQFFGPLTQHGSAFTPDFFENDLTSFVTPSRQLLFHTAGSAAAAARYQGGVPEYLHGNTWGNMAVDPQGRANCQAGQAGYLDKGNRFSPYGKRYQHAVVDSPPYDGRPIGPNFLTFDKNGATSVYGAR